MNNTQQVIVYRNQTEQAIDTFLYQDGGAAYLFILICAGVAFAIAVAVVGKIQRRRFQEVTSAQLICGCVAAIITAWLMWV